MKAFRSLVALLFACAAGIGVAHAQTAHVCQLNGLGHTTSFDNKRFDITRDFGTFSLIESDDLSVQVSTAPSRTNAQAAAVGRIAMRVGNTIYLFDTNGLKQVSGDSAGVTVTATPSTYSQGGSAKLTMSDRSTISIVHSSQTNDGGWASNLGISVPPSAGGKVRGLCGNFDGDPANDFVTPSGQAVQDVNTFAAAWTPPPGQDMLAGIPPAVASTLPVIAIAPATAAAPATAPAVAPASDQPRVCQLNGLGHTTSFDDKRFDITRDFGTFSLIESDDLSVQVSTAPSRTNAQAAAVARVAMRFGNTVYLFDTNGLKQVSDDSAGVTATATPSTGQSGSAKLTMGDGSTIKIVHDTQTNDGGWASNLQISRPPSAGSKVRGLCGNFDGDPANDFVTPSGQAVQDVNTFAAAWTPPPGQDLFTGMSPTGASAAAPAPAADQFGTVKTFQVTSQPAQHPAAQICLPQGYRLLGGGARVSTPGAQSFLTASYPEGQCWNGAAKDHINPSVATLDVYAIGIYDPDSLISISTLSMTSEVTPHPAVISPILPPPFAVTGGGAKVTYGGAGNILIASYPNDGNPKNTWVAASKDHDVSDPATVTSYVIGMLPQTQSGAKFDIVQVIATSPNPAAAAEATAVLPAGYSVIGGGAVALSTTNAGSLMTDSFPTANGWTARSHDHNDPDPARITVWAIGIRKVQ
jgi:hypothetical protein